MTTADGIDKEVCCAKEHHAGNLRLHDVLDPGDLMQQTARQALRCETVVLHVSMRGKVGRSLVPLRGCSPQSTRSLCLLEKGS